MGAIPGGIRQFEQSPRGRWLAACAVCLALGAVGGRFLAPTRTVTVTKEAEVAMDESRGLDLQKHEVKVVEPAKTTRERIVYRDGPVREKIVTVREQGGSTETKDTGVKVTDDLHIAAKVAEKTVERPEGRWSIRLLAGIDTRGGIVAGVAGDYRLLGPLTLGVWGTGPVGGSGQSPWTVGVSAGLRLP